MRDVGLVWFAQRYIWLHYHTHLIGCCIYFDFVPVDVVIKLVKHFDDELLAHLKKHRACVFELGVCLTHHSSDLCLYFLLWHLPHCSGDLIDFNNSNDEDIRFIIYKFVLGLKQLHDNVWVMFPPISIETYIKFIVLLPREFATWILKQITS